MEAPAYAGEDLAHARDQCRRFGGMVANQQLRAYGEYVIPAVNG